MVVLNSYFRKFTFRDSLTSHIAEWLRLLLMNTSCPVNDQPSCNFMLFNTFRELEGKYIDYLSVLDGRKVVPVGPLVQEIVNENTHTQIMEWLDSKDESSTVFVSFGTHQQCCVDHQSPERKLNLKLREIVDTKQSKINVLMATFLVRGHISPFLELAKKFAHENLLVYLCSTPINLKSIKKRITEKYSLSIKLVKIHLPSLPELPPHYHTTNGLPTHLNYTLRTAFDMAIPSVSSILDTLSPDLRINHFSPHGHQ
ncbi:hypothetical protein TEA_007518 [Camellia sinensis var. sinensis]|uniref:Glycosyltransferase N-terminal domain-containing protein n=1 Tax=Camellia sinensis var. sinensis TaxID=542762 RepID=A0A4S4DEG7_CAMSN|nr:hypothetical protein TEA_007518 [Camellia sinensis var. sinensis]